MRNRWTLTPRENEILGLMADGCSNAAIGRRLAIGEGTVKCHVNTILGKLVANNRTHAVAIALRTKLLNVEHVPEVAR